MQGEKEPLSRQVPKASEFVYCVEGPAKWVLPKCGRMSVLHLGWLTAFPLRLVSGFFSSPFSRDRTRDASSSDWFKGPSCFLPFNSSPQKFINRFLHRLSKIPRRQPSY